MASSEDNDQTVRDWLEEMIKIREVSPAYVLSILKEFEVTRKELVSMLGRCASKKRVQCSLFSSYTEMTRLIADMERQVAEDGPALEQEEEMIRPLKVEFDKLQAKHNQVAADPMSNYLIRTELGFESKLKARDQMNTPGLESLRAELKNKEEKKQSLEKELAIANGNIRSLKTSLDFYRVSIPGKDARKSEQF
ncbi:unnamed protein product [Allacma fusca]|uniref:Uncharacterized protein n=1 Tax=Allacma fusca TaxID=39272 RepID=A0A8J2LJY7_9HEXA|nr:unnamed protein product [Allacma fusca]